MTLPHRPIKVSLQSDEGGTVKVRKILTFVEETFSEAGQRADTPLRKVAVCALIENAFADKAYTDDLNLHIEGSETLGAQIADLAAKAMGPYSTASYGKAGVVGINGEQEHAVACLTTVYGNVLRNAVGGGKAWISSVTKRAGPGVTLDIPLAHKDALYVRSHYDAMAVTLHDGPLPNEVAVICCFANRGRLNDRVGGIRAEKITGEDGLT